MEKNRFVLDAAVLKELISRIVREQFPAAAIDAVEVKTDRDIDGDELYRVLIILNQLVEELDPKAMFGLVRHMRPGLEKIHAQGFPLVSFISRNDAAKLKREPA